MAYIGVLTRKGTCAICEKALPKGRHVYFNPSKRQGKHLACIPCWDTLRKSRSGSVLAKKEKPGPRISTEPLDAPF